jgi:hypothetical protein
MMARKNNDGEVKLNLYGVFRFIFVFEAKAGVDFAHAINQRPRSF